MVVITINSGSTSVKLAAFDCTGPAITEILRRKRSGASLDAHEVLNEFVRELGACTPEATSHRVVHGGSRFTGPVRLDDAVQAELEQLSALAPLHNPVALRWIKAARELCSDRTAHVAAFDTAFFSKLPRVSAEYALPASLGIDQGVRRYGFHGLAHEAMWRRWCELRPDLTAGGRLITLQLGGGCSIAAIDRGRPLDTSMGFSPLEGLMMATRTGDIDAAVVPYLAQRLGVSCDQIIERFNRESGLLGVSGLSKDVNDVLASKAPNAQLAAAQYCYRARKYIGAYLTVLGGCDGIVFGGGVGEHIPEVRARIITGLQWAGIDIDPVANEGATGDEASIGRAGQAINVYAIPVDEELALARAAQACL
jgi:acetate kinase